MGNSPRQGAGFFPTQRETGFSIPPPKATGANNNNSTGADMPYHANVLPIKASPKDTPGFGDDAFRPLWDGEQPQKQTGFEKK